MMLQAFSPLLLPCSQAMKHELTLFACVQKEARGLDLAIEKAKQRMARYGIEPNMLIMVPETQLYITMVPPEMRQHFERGERGPSQYDSYAGNRTWASFRGLDCFTTNPFDSGDNVDSVQMLRRNTQVGEFYVMAPPYTWESSTALPKTYMDILIYDEHRDRLSHITFREAMMHAMPWQLEVVKNRGKGGLVSDPFNFGSDDHIKYVNASQKALGDSAPTLNLKDFAYDRTAFMGLVAAAEAGVWVPMQIVITRPFIEHQMLSAILTVKGSDTGNTLFGPADMQVSANTTVKVIEGHYTCHTKAIVTKPQNVMIMRDIQCDGYVAGADCVWFGDIAVGNGRRFREESEKDGSLGEAVAQDLRDRLEFAHEYDNQYGSMFAFASPLDDNPQFLQDNAFSLNEQRLPWDVGNNTSRQTVGGAQGMGAISDRNFPGGDAFFESYKRLFRLDYITQGVDSSSVSDRTFVRNGTYNNAIVLLGPHRCYSPFTKSYFDLTPGQCHFGPDALPGDARWRRGEAVDAQSARGALVGVEALAEARKAMHRMDARGPA